MANAKTTSSEFAVKYGENRGFDCKEHDDFYVLCKPKQSEFSIEIETEKENIFENKDGRIKRESKERKKVTVMIPKGGLADWLWRQIKKLIDDS